MKYIRTLLIGIAALAAACTVAVVAYIHRVGFSRALPAIQNDLSLSDFQTGVLAAVFSLAYGAFEIPCGLLGDRLGVRHLLTVLVLGWSLMTVTSAPARRKTSGPMRAAAP